MAKDSFSHRGASVCVLRAAFRDEPLPPSSGRYSNATAAYFRNSPNTTISIAADPRAGRMGRPPQVTPEAPGTRIGVRILGIGIRR